MNEARQRTTFALLAAVATFGTLAVGCQARGSVEAAQTAVVMAQTALPAVQAAATSVSGALTDSQAVLTTLQGLLGGATLDVKTTPPDASNDAVTNVSIDGADGQGTLTQIDSRTRQATAAAALMLAAQYYPNATIALSVVDRSGNSLIKATKAPGQMPAIQ